MIPINPTLIDSVIDGYPLSVGTPASFVSNCTQSLITRDGITGVQLVGNGLAANIQAEFTFTARTLPSGSIGFLIYVSDFSGEAVMGLTAYLGDSTLTNHFIKNVTLSQVGYQWIVFSPPTSGVTWKWAVGGGTPVFGTTSFGKTRIRFDFTLGKTPKIEFFGAFENPRSTKPQIVFSFDDGYDSVFSLARPSFSKYNLKFSCGIIADTLNAPGSSMTTDNLKQLVSEGHEMVVHGPIGGAGSLQNYQASTTRYQDTYNDIKFHRDFLVNNGLAKNGSEKCYIFPQGFNVFDGSSGNTEIANILKSLGFVIARGVGNLYNDVIPNGLASSKTIMYLPITGHAGSLVTATENANIANIIQRIREAGQTGKHCVLMMHKITAAAITNPIEIQQSNLELILDAAADEIASGRMASGNFVSLYSALTRKRAY